MLKRRWKGDEWELVGAMISSFAEPCALKVVAG
jgi:hypothetical protein